MGHVRLSGLSSSTRGRGPWSIVGAFIVITSLLAACAPAPPEREPLPDLSEALPPPADCAFLVGGPRGVLVEEVIPDGAADGVLEVGDVIVEAGGADTPDAASLLSALEPSAPGDDIDIDYIRDGSESTTTLALGANPDDPDRPMIGIMIRTDYESIPAGDAEGPVADGPTVRPLTIGDTIYLLDPLTATWEPTGVTVPDGMLWVSTASRFYGVDDTAIIDLGTGDEVVHDGIEGWEVTRAIGSIGGDLLLVVTRPLEESPEQVALSVARLDPKTGSTVWVMPVLAGFGIPVAALGAPGGEHTLLVGVSEDGSELMGVQVWDGNGADIGVEGLIDLGTPIGWLDPATVMLRSEEGVANLVAISTGEAEQRAIDPQLSELPLFAVGDGHSLLAIDGQALVLDDLDTDAEVRALARDCRFVRIGEPGWTGV